MVQWDEPMNNNMYTLTHAHAHTHTQPQPPNLQQLNAYKAVDT